MPEVYHTPALLPQTIEALDIKPCGTYIDVTYGGGGHSNAILDRLDTAGRLIAFDQDSDAIERARAIGDNRLTMVHANFRYLANFLRYLKIGQVDGIMADLGVSFHHFDDPSRGFSFRWDAPLDMRMNRNSPVTAAKLLAEAPEEKLSSIMSLYGEVRNASRITREIIKARGNAPVDTVGRLLETVKPFINPRQEKKELACIFQALRIEVNDELGALRDMLSQALTALKPGGRLAIITYHSLEDRLVKNFMRSGNVEGRVEEDFFGHRTTPLKPLTSRPIVPDEAEITNNPRSRSAKLRAAIKTTSQPSLR